MSRSPSRAMRSASSASRGPKPKTRLRARSGMSCASDRTSAVERDTGTTVLHFGSHDFRPRERVCQRTHAEEAARSCALVGTACIIRATTFHSERLDIPKTAEKARAPTSLWATCVVAVVGVQGQQKLCTFYDWTTRS